MKLVAIAALIAVCGAAKLDRTYLPPPSADTAGGSSESLQTPLSRSSSGQGESSGSLPTGSYTNDFQGVVVDAAAAGIRASTDGDQSGLGEPRESYGTTNSKVGDAAFRGSVAGFRSTPTIGSSGLNGQVLGINQNFGAFESKSERPQAFKDRNSNIITYANDVSSDNYSYGFETDNGIAIGENGVANNGIQAQGGYSYKGDDGQVYKVTYVADEGGYRPQGDHLPTPPPIPKEILESLEQNAKEEAAGIVDDGSYDAQKYNAEGDYTHHNGGNIQYNDAQLAQFAKRPESDATASNTFINQNSQAFGKPGQLGNIGAQSTHSNSNGQLNQLSGNKFGSNFANNQNGLAGSQDKPPSQTMSGHQESLFTGQHGFGHTGQSSGSQLTSQFSQTQSTFGAQSSHFGTQNNQQQPSTPFGTQGSATSFGSQFSQLASSDNQVGSASQLNTQPTNPSFAHTSSSAFNSQSNQGTQIDNQAFNPQSSFSLPSQAQSSFGKPSQFNNDKQEHSHDSQIQFGTQGLNKPSFGSFGSNKPSNIGQGQSNIFASTVADNGNGFPNTQFGDEYLPPFNKPQVNGLSTPQDSNKDNQIQNIVPLDGQSQSSQGSSATSFASVGSAGFGPQAVKPMNAFQNKPSRPNQFNFNSNNQLTSQGQTVLNAFPTSPQHSESHTASTLAAGTKPTPIPEIELATPLEPNEKPASSQGSQINSQSLPSFGFQSLNYQAQQQLGFQSNIPAYQQSTGQALASSFPDFRPQETSPFGSASTLPNVLPATQQPGFNGEQQQFPQNSFGPNQQNNAETQKTSSSQGPNDSYYYKQPSRPFGTPAARPEGSRFPSSPSYQSNGVVSPQNNQFLDQQGSLTSSTKFPSSSSSAPVAPTSSSQYTQTQASQSTNYYNGITQASISPFPSLSPTTSTQNDATQAVQFGSKPSSNQPSSQFQPNKPTISQQHSEVSLLPSKPTTFGQDSSFTQFQFGQSSSTNKDRPSVIQSFPSNSVPTIGQTLSASTQNQNQYGHSSSINKDQPSVIQSFPSNSDSSLGQTPSHSFTENQILLGQSTLTNNDHPENPETSQQQQTQQYQGTIYEYNKPAEVLPAPAQTDSSSSQSLQTDSSSKPQENQETNTQESKPQFESQQTQFGQTSSSSQSLQSNLNQGTKPQVFKPFGSLPSNIQFGQKTKPTLSQTSLQHNIQGSQGNVQPDKPSESTSFTTTQFGQTSQLGLGSGSHFGPQPEKPLVSPSQFGQNTQQLQGTSQTSSFTSFSNTQGLQSGVQPFKPSGSAQPTTTQFGHNTQTGAGSQTLQQGSGYQYGAQTNKPFGSSSSPSQLGQAGPVQSSHNSFTSTQQNTQSSQIGAQPFKPFETTSSIQGSQPFKPFGTSSGFQGYPSTKPQMGTQLTQTQFTQTSQQHFGSTQISSQPARGPQFDAIPAKPFGNAPSIHGSPDSQKPQFGQNTQLNQGSQPSGFSYGHGTHLGSVPSKPQVGTQTQFIQNQNAFPKPFGSASGQAQVGQNSAQASSTAVSQQQPQSAHTYKPFGAPSTQGSGFLTQNKPQNDQAPQPSQGAITTSSQFGAQPFKPFSSTGAQGSQNKPESLQYKPFGTQQGSSCCQGSKDSSSIGPLNVGKPSQAFAQTQSQFTGFSGAQGFNVQSVAGKGEEFGGPRQPPSFDEQSGYHY